MDIVRTTLGAPSRMLKRLASGVLGKLLDVDDSQPTEKARHGGVSGTSRSDSDLDADRRKKRRTMLSDLLGLPPGTDVDIVVDANAERLTFVIRDRATGRNLRTVPEAEAKELIERFAARHGSFVDRSL